MEQKSCIPLPLDSTLLVDLVDQAKDWALFHGVSMRSKDHFSRDSVTFAPFLLLPSTFPETEFRRAVRIQTLLNELMHKIAYDDDFLRTTLAKTIRVDSFTGRLFKIYDTLKEEGFVQDVSLGLFRSDYFLDGPTGIIKQVEFNTISSSFGALTSILPTWHRKVLRNLGYSDKAANVVGSDTIRGYANGIIKALNYYNNGSIGGTVLFVIEDKSFNIADQRFLEFEIQNQDPSIRVLRRTLTEIGNHGRLDHENKLFMNNEEIGVVYYRVGYMPGFYHSELEWSARLLLERSRAIKCPSIHYQLAGAKKIQQELSFPGVLERFLSNPNDVKDLREVFTGLYSLDLGDKRADEAIELATSQPENYVLKPQREGGGNNLYDRDICSMLNQIKSSEERNAWILMDKINPTPQKNYIIRPGVVELSLTDVVGELGIFGVICGNEKTILFNEQVGHMVRSKSTLSNEGGVATGSGALDSVYLIQN